MVPDGMIKDDWADSSDKDSDEEDANPHSTQVGQGYLHWNWQVKVICTALQTTNNTFIYYMLDANSNSS